MLYACTASLLLVIGCVLFHYEALRLIGSTAAGVQQHRQATLVVIFGVVVAHLAEILLYTLAMYLAYRFGLGSLANAPHPRAAQYFYLSAEIFTTVGIGDIYPLGDMRLITSLEPLMGMLLISWSGSYTYFFVQRYWNDLLVSVRRPSVGGVLPKPAARPSPVTQGTESNLPAAVPEKH